MSKPLEGIRVVEVAMWAFVPSAGGILADWGAEVIKIEAPTGDPIRGLVSGGVGKTDGITYTWELFNRGKHGIALDLKEETAQKIVYQLAETADVFLTSLLPRARQEAQDRPRRHSRGQPADHLPVGSGQGARGPEAEKGGYDSISFWSRGSVSSSVTPNDHAPIGMPAGAFGDSLSGMGLAGGIAAPALAHKAKTGEGGLVDGSLLGTAMWSMQMGIVGATVAGLDEMPKGDRTQVPNPLVNTYPTSDGRWIALCMLQPDVYWADFCMAIGRKDLIDDERFANGPVRATARRGVCRRARQDVRDQVVGRVEAALGDPAGPMGRGEPGVRHARRPAGAGQSFRADGRLRRRSRAPADREPGAI